MYKALQGNLGLGKAIEYFTSQSIPLAIPLNDTQKYDLIADFQGKLQRVSVKTSTSTKNGISYEVQLRNTGGSSGVSKVRPFDNTTCDYVFIYTGDNKMYLIPAKDIDAINSINVGNKWTNYIVKSKSLIDFVE